MVLMQNGGITIVYENWKNKNGTGDRSCNCGSWKQHWINSSGKPWSNKCSILGCDKKATLGTHIINASVLGEYIVPACYSCNQLNNEFDLKENVKLVPANKQKTREK